MSRTAGFELQRAEELMAWAVSTYGERFAIATSFQKEGMVLIDLAAHTGGRFRVFTIDTGRLPQETLEMLETVRRRWAVTVEVISPDPAEVADMVKRHGQNLFYDRTELRQLCCEVRKVRPLERKLREFDAWASGMRREQSDTRAAIPRVASVNARVKLNPLADWTSTQVEDYIKRHDVPVHPLYSHGYASIGCAPCTRAIEPGEDERAGRWWWEADSKKECGLHFALDGSVRRAS